MTVFPLLLFRRFSTFLLIARSCKRSTHKLKTTMMSTTTALLLFMSVFVAAEEYAFDFTRNGVTPDISYNGNRVLQTFSNEPDCDFVGDKLECTQQTSITGQDGVILMNFSVRCNADARFKFDYRRAQNCQCFAQIIYEDDPSKPSKMCPCSVCHPEFGDNPINVDCSEEFQPVAAGDEKADDVVDSVSLSDTDTDSVTIDSTVASAEEYDPFIVNSCVSLDCSSSCNGTCALNCADSDESCEFCANNENNQPTKAPTGEGTQDLENFKPASGTVSTSSVLLGSLAAAFLMLVL